MKYKNGFITFKLDPDMREFMLGLKEQGNFTKTFEKYILPMESLYAKRIYEMLYQVKKYGYRKFELEELQKVLDIPKSFKSYFNFKARVLVIAIKEINKYTDIYIPVDTDNLKDESWIKLQCGKTRKITHLNFEFRLKSDKGLFEVKNQKTIRDEILEYIDIDIMTATLPNSIKQAQIQYLQERLSEYIEWVESVDNVMLNKLRKDWNTSFDRHISGYEKNLNKLDKRL
jgi:plasmid replication initiation protein